MSPLCTPPLHHGFGLGCGLRCERLRLVCFSGASQRLLEQHEPKVNISFNLCFSLTPLIYLCSAKPVCLKRTLKLILWDDNDPYSDASDRNSCTSCICSNELVVMNLWWKQLPAVVMIMPDTRESPPSPPHTGLGPVIMLLFTCNTLPNLFGFNPFRNLCTSAAGLVTSGYVTYLCLWSEWAVFPAQICAEKKSPSCGWMFKVHFTVFLCLWNTVFHVIYGHCSISFGLLMCFLLWVTLHVRNVWICVTLCFL